MTKFDSDLVITINEKGFGTAKSIKFGKHVIIISDTKFSGNLYATEVDNINNICKLHFKELEKMIK